MVFIDSVNKKRPDAHQAAFYNCSKILSSNLSVSVS